ncbi:MAG: sulfite exporter TauE/SafE family protein [Chitinophagaceae bacterium]
MLAGVIISGLLLGVAGSFHCAGMCGPLVLSLPMQQSPGVTRTVNLLLYNVGRIVTYTSIGLLMGLVGRRIYLAGFQQWLSVLMGIIVLFLALQYFLRKHIGQPVWAQLLYTKLLQWMGRFLQLRNGAGFFLLGMINGLLPCGMVYLALAGALSNASVVSSGLFMFSFGTGTLPVMLALSIWGLKMNLQLRTKFKQFIPYVTVAMGIILILRGMNLGIPFISPILADAPQQAVSCH